MRKNKGYSAKVNRVPPGNNPKMKTKPRTVDEMLADMVKPTKKAKKAMKDEGIEIFVDFQVW